MQIVRRIREWRYAGVSAAFAACVGAGFFLSGAKVGGVASFADISAAGAVGLPYSAAVFTGSLVRSIAAGTIGDNIVKLASLALIVIIKMFLEPRNDLKLCGINTAVSVLVSGAAVSAVIGELAHKLVFYGFYGGVAGFAAYSASRLITGLKKDRVADLSGTGGLSCSVVYIMAAASLCSLELPAVNIGIVFCGAVTLMGAYFYKQTGGVLCGALSVCGAFLASSAAGMSIVLLPAAGLLTGYMHNRKPQTAAAFFVGVCFVLNVLTGAALGEADSMIDIICGALIFMPLSGRFSDKWIRTGDDGTVMLPDAINARMGFLSDAVLDLRRESERISEMLSEGRDETREIEDNSRAVCSACYRRPFCWKSDKGNTLRGFRRLAEMAELAEESFPAELDDCLRKKELLAAFAESSRERAAAKLMEMRFSESRELLCEQLKITEELVRSAGERVDVRYSHSVSRSVRARLEKFGFAPSQVIAYYNSRSRLLTEIYFPADSAPVDGRRICDLIADELRLKMGCTEPVCTGREVRIRVFEKPRFTMEVCASSACADDSEENGDTHTVFTDGAEAGYVVLSDGMGTGRGASAQSSLVVSLFRRLVTSGADVGSAIKLINSVMVTDPQDESFATLDAVRIDLDDCGLTVIKSGAAATLIRHRGNVMKLNAPTFPIGIYGRSEVYVRECGFEEGDIVIMFSDGVSENAYSFIKELLLGGDDLRHIVGEICRKAHVFDHTLHSDDVTVIGIKVTS